MEGDLEKWTNYINFWQTRRFVLKGVILLYFIPEENLSKPKCKIHMGVANIIDNVKEGEDDTNFEFQIDSGSAVFSVKAKSKEDKKKWLTALKQAKIEAEKMIKFYSKNKSESEKFENFKGGYKRLKERKKGKISPEEIDALIKDAENCGKGKVFVENLKLKQLFLLKNLK